jgi:quercetin dioxygenase-like cupin family protein
MAVTGPEAQAMVHVRFGEPQHPCDGMQLALVDMARLRGGPAPVNMSRFVLAPGARSKLDRHEDREMWMFAQGTGMLSYRGCPAIAVQAGVVVEFEPDASHTLHNTGSEPLVVFSIWWVDLR